MYKLISFVRRAKNRRKILLALAKPYTPTELSEMIDSHRSSVSRTLIELSKKGLVECVTPEEKTGRLYCITSLGREIIEKGLSD